MEKTAGAQQEMNHDKEPFASEMRNTSFPIVVSLDPEKASTR